MQHTAANSGRLLQPQPQLQPAVPQHALLADNFPLNKQSCCHSSHHHGMHHTTGTTTCCADYSQASQPATLPGGVRVYVHLQVVGTGTCLPCCWAVSWASDALLRLPETIRCSTQESNLCIAAQLNAIAGWDCWHSAAAAAAHTVPVGRKAAAAQPLDEPANTWRLVEQDNREFLSSQ